MVAVTIFLLTVVYQLFSILPFRVNSLKGIGIIKTPFICLGTAMCFYKLGPRKRTSEWSTYLYLVFFGVQQRQSEDV